MGTFVRLPNQWDSEDNKRIKATKSRALKKCTVKISESCKGKKSKKKLKKNKKFKIFFLSYKHTPAGISF